MSSSSVGVYPTSLSPIDFSMYCRSLAEIRGCWAGESWTRSIQNTNQTQPSAPVSKSSTHTLSDPTNRTRTKHSLVPLSTSHQHIHWAIQQTEHEPNTAQCPCQQVINTTKHSLMPLSASHQHIHWAIQQTEHEPNTAQCPCQQVINTTKHSLMPLSTSHQHNQTQPNAPVNKSSTQPNTA